jgi:hypothetical protein
MYVQFHNLFAHRFILYDNDCEMSFIHGNNGVAAELSILLLSMMMEY